MDLNNWVIHKIADSGVISTLQRSVGGVDDSLWRRLPNLAPGQAIVTFTHMQRPVRGGTPIPTRVAQPSSPPPSPVSATTSA